LIAGLRPIAVLALCAASFILFAWQLASDDAFAFMRSNALLPPMRKLLMAEMIGAAAAVALGCLVYLAIRGHRGVKSLSVLARILCPITLAGVLPPLMEPGAWPDTLSAAAAIGVFVVLVEALGRVSFNAWQEYGKSSTVFSPLGVRSRNGRIAALVVFAASAAYAVYFSTYTVFAHWRFQTYNFDLGQYDNIFWNLLHGRPMVCTPLGAVEPWSSFSGHADLGAFFLVPFYAIYPHAETLLVMQSVILGLGAIPVYFFAARRLAPSYACMLAIAYLLYPPLHGANFYDFHFQPVAATFVLFTIWFLDARKWILATLAFIVAISCREDISVGLTFLGIYLVLTGYRPRAGAIMAVVGTIYFVVIRFVIMARYGQGWFSDIYKELYPLPAGPNSYGGVMQTLATNPSFVFRSLLTPEKLRFFLQIMTPLAFLALRRPYLLPSLAPGALFTLFTTAYPPTTDIGFQYTGHFIPYIFTASAIGLASCVSLGQVKGRAAVAALLVGTFLCTRHWGAVPPSTSFRGGFSVISFARPTKEDREKHRDLLELASMIPEGASFAVSEQELPHVSTRLKVFALRDGTGNAEYLLYGTSSAGANHGQEALSSGAYVEVATRPGLVLLRRK
jgi:uncharacterized membrane protein